MNQDGKVPTVERIETIKAENGGTLHVRRASRHTQERIMDAAGLRDGDTASAVRFARLMFQWSVVGCEIPGVEFKVVKHPLLGMIADVSVYESDAITADDIAKVTKVATSPLPASATGN